MALLKATPVSRFTTITLKVPEHVLERAEHYAHFAKLSKKDEVLVQSAIYVMDADVEFQAYLKTNPLLPRNNRGPKPHAAVQPSPKTDQPVAVVPPPRK